MKLSEARKLKAGDRIGTNDNCLLKAKYRNKKGLVVSSKLDEYNRTAVELVMNKKGRKEILSFYPELLCAVEEVDKQLNAVLCPMCNYDTLILYSAVIEKRRIKGINSDEGIEMGQFIETYDTNFDKVRCDNCGAEWEFESTFLDEYNNAKAKKVS